jgi:putative redox protein
MTDGWRAERERAAGNLLYDGWPASFPNEGSAMSRQASTIPVSATRTVEAWLELPPGEAVAGVLFAHCLPAENPALALISARFADRGCAVLAVDCGAGAGHLQTALAPQELLAAARYFGDRHAGPLLLIGHSWGGVLALACAADLPQVQALVTVGAPAGSQGFSQRATQAEGRVAVGGQAMALPDEGGALDWTRLRERVEHLRRPLLILHAPLDNVADISNAAQIFTAAKHPKSFVSLDSADHLLARPGEAQHAADVICGWAGRYLQREEAPAEHHTEVVVAEAGGGKYRQHVKAGRHRSLADEPPSAGGNDAGPSPYELLLSALGACTAMTLRMYADLKKLPLTRVSVELRHEKIHAEACRHCETREGKIDRIERIVTLEGDLTEDQRNRMLEIANKCPVHRTLHSEVWVPTSLAPPRDQ